MTIMSHKEMTTVRLAPELLEVMRDGQLKWVIAHGLSPSGMPAANGILRDEEMWAIVTYLRHLPAKGSLGEPAMYGGDPAPSPHP